MVFRANAIALFTLIQTPERGLCTNASPAQLATHQMR